MTSKQNEKVRLTPGPLFHLLSHVLGLTTVVFLLPCCGTIAGNPKKPSNPPAGASDTPPADPGTQATLNQMRLPLISLDIGDTTADDIGSGLRLFDERSSMFLSLETNDPEEISQKVDQRDTVLNGWSKRLERIIDNMNNVSRGVNQLLQSDQTEVEPQKARLRKKGQEKRISGVIEKKSENNVTTFQATVCFGDRLGAQLTWDEGQTKVSFTRDLGAKVNAPDEDIPLITHLTIEKRDGGTLYQLATSGTWKAFRTESSDGGNQVDFTESFVRASGTIDLKYVADSFETPPTTQLFEGETYLVGRIHPTALKAPNGKPRTRKEFVAYHKSFAQGPCKNGFDENSPTVWKPDLSEPRFCLGRPLGSAKFKNISAYFDTLASLQPIGIASKSLLKIPAFTPGSSCDL